MRTQLAVLTILVAFAPAGASAGQAAVVVKEVVKAGKKAVDTHVPGGTAGLKSKAAAALGAVPAGTTQALKGAAGQKSFTPEQLTQVQAQAGQAFAAVTADPRAAAMAAKAGVTPEKLQALQAQTAAAAAGFKGASARQAGQFLRTGSLRSRRRAGRPGSSCSRNRSPASRRRRTRSIPT